MNKKFIIIIFAIIISIFIFLWLSYNADVAAISNVEVTLDNIDLTDIKITSFKLILNVNTDNLTTINRQVRTAVWLFKMLYDYSQNGNFNHRNIIDGLSYDTKNDKAFANSGIVTHPFMCCDRLTNPIIKKNEIKKIILDDGQTLLSPERRFDAILYYSSDLF